MNDPIATITSLQADNLHRIYCEDISFESDGSLSNDPKSHICFRLMMVYFVEAMHDQHALLLRLKAVAEATEYLDTDEIMQTLIRSVETLKDIPTFREFYALERDSDEGWNLADMPVLRKIQAPLKNPHGSWHIDSSYMVLLLWRSWCYGCDTLEMTARKMIEVVDLYARAIDAQKTVIEVLENAHQDGVCAKKVSGGILTYRKVA
jgi:hypothetical protein